MNPVQKTLAELQEKGWSLAAIADEIDVSYNAVQKWKAGDRQPSNSKLVAQGLETLLQQGRIPKKRRVRQKNNTRRSPS